MGLDMYLRRRVYLGLNYEHNRTGEINIVINGKTFPSNPTEIIYQAAYWRKANQIHKWFVDNVQNL